MRKARTTNRDASEALPALTTEIDLLPLPGSTSTERCILLAGDVQGCGPDAIRLMPFGGGSDDDSYLMRVIGWRRMVPLNTSDHRGLWVPPVLAGITVTLSAFVGPSQSNFPLVSTDRFADTLSVTSQPVHSITTTNYDAASFVYSPANDTPGWILVRTFGAELVEIQTADNTTTPTTNAIYNWEYDDDE